MLTRLRLGFSHLSEHKFRHGLKDVENISISFSTVNDNSLSTLLLYGHGKVDDTKIRKILMPTNVYLVYSWSI